jgi:hypothetical protein
MMVAVGTGDGKPGDRRVDCTLDCTRVSHISPSIIACGPQTAPLPERRILCNFKISTLLPITT